MRLKHLCRSFSTPIMQSEVEQTGKYEVYGASGLVGYLDEYGVESAYLGIVKDGAGVGRVQKYKRLSSLLGTMAYIIPNDDVDIDWLKYVVMGLDLGNDVNKTTIPHIYFSEYGNREVHYVNYDLQRKIAGFLDSKCARIDSVIEKTQASIEEYKKLKQAIITEAVTKGIRPNRKMKDSGIEWIGDIPSDWVICKVRHIGATQNGISKGAESFGQGFPFVSYGDVYRNISLPREVKGLIDTTEDERKIYSVERGDIFFTRTSETIEEVGFSSVCEESVPEATFAGFLIRVRPYGDDLDIGYSKYYFRSNHHRFYLAKQMNLVTRASLGQPLLKGMPVLVPPKEEQIEIADYLNEKCSKIKTIVQQKEGIITELEGYKKSLIFECVTGKKEVSV